MDNWNTMIDFKNMICLVCNKQFGKRGSLKRHMSTHSGQKPYPCMFCPKRFSRRSHQTMHIRVHTGERPFPCELCQKRFMQKSDLVRHMRTHTGEKPFACELCEKRYAQKSHLTIHMKTHSGKRSFDCPKCTKTFSTKSSLRNHIKMFHEGKPTCVPCVPAEQMSFQQQQPWSLESMCLLCGKHFPNRLEMTTHMQNQHMHELFRMYTSPASTLPVSSERNFATSKMPDMGCAVLMPPTYPSASMQQQAAMDVPLTVHSDLPVFSHIVPPRNTMHVSAGQTAFFQKMMMSSSGMMQQSSSLSSTSRKRKADVLEEETPSKPGSSPVRDPGV